MNKEVSCARKGEVYVRFELEFESPEAHRPPQKCKKGKNLKLKRDFEPAIIC